MHFEETAFLARAPTGVTLRYSPPLNNFVPVPSADRELQPSISIVALSWPCGVLPVVRCPRSRNDPDDS
jgi:hypothetical protein